VHAESFQTNRHVDSFFTPELFVLFFSDVMNYSDILIKNNNSGSFHSTCLEHLWQKSLLGNDLIVLWLTHLLEASHIHRIVEVKSSWRGSVMQSHFQVSPKTFC